MSAGRIVIVEDEAKYRDALTDALTFHGYEVESAADGAAGLVLIRRTVPDAVVLDWILPILDGGALTRAIKGDPALSRVFVLIASARAEGANRAEGIEIGADDYLAKPVETKELLARLRNGLTMRRLQAELEEKNRELARLAATDALTELPNRRSFDQTLARELRGAKRYADDVSLVLLDIDLFKAVNDRYGHGVGDEVLKEIGNRLREACRAGDHVARVGGEEFALILTRTSAEGAVAAAERTRALISEPAIRTFAGDLVITASLGVACAGGEIGFDARDLFRAADDALYRSKDEGRARVTLSRAPSLRRTGPREKRG
ncbi:MAG: GGDEF domain-containing response regulator [Thermoanaerobaculia bacterium]